MPTVRSPPYALRVRATVSFRSSDSAVRQPEPRRPGHGGPGLAGGAAAAEAAAAAASDIRVLNAAGAALIVACRPAPAGLRPIRLGSPRRPGFAVANPGLSRVEVPGPPPPGGPEETVDISLQ